MPQPSPDAVAVATLGGAGGVLDDEAVRAFVHDRVGALDIAGRSVCVLVPDATRSCPLPLLLGAVLDALEPRASRVTVVVALGTHAPMAAERLAAHVGFDQRTPAATTTALNHAWWDPATFATVGTIDDATVARLTDGRLRVGTAVRVNRAVVEHDRTLVVGPVLPHEVVGFSGGTKYLFPGVSGQEMIDLSHWVGALVTSPEIIGTPGPTPVRALIDRAAALLRRPVDAVCVVTEPGSQRLHSVAMGEVHQAWVSAVAVSAATHVRYLDAPMARVLSLVSTRYDDLWTGAKGFYKVEPVVADGGQVVLYAPHLREIAPHHPVITEIGYHCRDYFVGQWNRFAHLPWGDLAHATHLRGAGTWSAADGERCRVTVTLATGIPEAEVRAVGLDHLDPDAVDVAAWAADPHTLVVPDAGEELYRLRAP